MNRRILVLLFCGCFSLCGVAEIINNSTKIDLKGNIPSTPGPKSMIVTAPVEATLCEELLTIEFLHSLGNVTILVESQKGVAMHKQTVNAAAGSSLTVDTKAWCNGVYTLLITDDVGRYLEGVFEIDR